MRLECNSQCVTSKYFECKTVMDESLSDFQVNKKSHKGPKVDKKISKPKYKKVIKHIKGQKDIRTVLKKSKCDLVSYTKEFDNVCKKTGVDVDSDQLHLAIALSKSLQTDTSDASTSQLVTPKSRLAKIRTTLQEYGFKVPATKINTNTNKKLKKERNQYKLITITEDERHQKITSKYAEVLLDCFYSSKNNDVSFHNESDALMFHLASNVTYDFFRDHSIFYVANLLEKSTTSGYMLRDWAEIPGRPVSPILFDKSRMDFKECSQKELDVILSGSIRSAKDVIANIKHSALNIHTNNVIEVEDLNDEKHKQYNCDDGMNDNGSQEILVSNNSKIMSDFKDTVNTNKIEIIDLESTSNFVDKEENRCCSPDLFEDDVSCMMETSRKSLSQGQKTKIFTEDVNFMDLTECANYLFPNHEKTVLINRNTQNRTKRKSDDFMDITQCAVSASQGIQKEKGIDLTQSPDKEAITVAYTSPDPNIILNEDGITKSLVLNDSISNRNRCTLTDVNSLQNSVTEINKVKNVEEDQKVFIGVNKSNELKIIEDVVTIQLDNDNIDLTQSSKEENCILTSQDKEGRVDELEYMDLTQSSRSSACLDDLPDINLNNTEELQSNMDDTIILKEEEYLTVCNNEKKSITVQYDQVLDLTQVADDTAEEDSQRKIRENQSFYDDFVHDHSNGNANTQCNVSGHRDTSEENIHIDLEQFPCNTSIRAITDESIIRTTSSSSLGKRDDNISIDYDEVCDNLDYIQSNKENSLNSEKHDSLDFHLSNCMNQDNSINEVTNSSQESEVFDLTDRELDNSLHKSKYDDCNLDFGGISVMDNNITSVNIKNNMEKRPPDINRKSIVPNNEKTIEAKVANSIESIDNCPDKMKDIVTSSISTDSIVTPNNSKYIVKINEVTPMLDYQSMTTPQRNKELDKYGLRPFKRKRAIQILTHLYNQTHPVIESYLYNDQPSPSKKSRMDTEPSYHPTTMQKSPRKPEIINKSPNKKCISRKSNSPRSGGIRRNENSPRKSGSGVGNVVCTYEVSSEVPVIQSLDCNPEDWVFQKKEKAKIHSCRVPLHIAFHNYISSRRNLREAILKYEPVNIDIIHKDLVSYGHRYDPKDLLRFLDKKCITVKTADNNGRNKR